MKEKKTRSHKIKTPYSSGEPIHDGIINQLGEVDKEKVFLYYFVNKEENLKCEFAVHRLHNDFY